MNKNDNNMTQKQMLWAVYTALLGVPNTDDKGLVGEFKELQNSHDKRITNVSRRVWMIIGGLTVVGILLGNGKIG